MKSDTRFSDALHVLLHLAEGDAPAPSERLAAALQTNPVVLRRLMAGLREAGVVRSAKGHGGGWVLARPLGQITLADVHRALGAPALVSFGFREDRPACLVAQAVHAALGAARADAEQRLQARLADVTLAALAHDFEQRHHARRRAPHRLQEHVDAAR
jgi:Rrf2 family protein